MAKKKQASIALPSTTRQVEMKADDKTQVFYANNVGIEGSNFDMKIRFGLIQSASPEMVSVRDIAHVYMTHEQAKAMISVMVETLNKLEVMKPSVVVQ